MSERVVFEALLDSRALAIGFTHFWRVHVVSVAGKSIRSFYKSDAEALAASLNAREEELERLKSANAAQAAEIGRLKKGVQLDCYDAGLLGDGGGGNVEWWQDYIRSELARAHDFYQSQVAALTDKEPTQ